MSRLPQRIAYLRDCHRADSRELALYDLLGRQADHRLFVEGREEILEGSLDRLPVLPEWGEGAQKAAALYAREKQLVYAAFLIVARDLPVRGARRDVTAPLLWWPAEILDGPEGSGVLFVRPDLDEAQVNVPVLTALMGEETEGAGSIERLLAALPDPPYDAAGLDALARALAEAVPSLDVAPLGAFPEVLSEGQVRAALSGLKAGEARCVPAACAALVSNPPETQGVLYELDTLARADTFSAPLVRLLGEPDESRGQDAAATNAPATGGVPAVLSAPQEKVLASGAREPLTFVVGPPGTGKSYTVAALALDHALRGEPVLLTARTDEALVVLAEKIRLLAGTDAFVVRGGRGAYLWTLKRYLEDILRGVLPLAEVADRDPAAVRRELASAERRVSGLERRIAHQGGLELALGRAASGEGLFAGLRTRLLDWRLGRRDPAWALLADYHQALAARTRARSVALRVTLRRRLEEVVANHRADLARFVKGLSARTSSRQARLFAEADLSVLTRAFPIWLSTLSAVHRVLPLQPELFSLVVLDEATQCDAASCLPAFQRARRVVVTGDPRQLRHVSFLSTERQRLLADRHALDDETRHTLDYRNRSVLDLVEQSAGAVAFLDEHYRSRPHLISFSNREFYRDALKVMTHRPELAAARCIEVRRVDGARGDDGVNRREAEALVDAFARWLRTAPSGETAGILSPFRDQVEYLRQLLDERFTYVELARRWVTVGTAYAFQGQERDVMFLSLAVDARSPAAALRWLERPDVFNVSVTRARRRQEVFSSLDPKDAARDGILGRYLEHAASPPEPPTGEEVDDRFLGEVLQHLAGAGLSTHPAWPLGGVTVDVIAADGDRSLGIDLVGHPGLFGAALPVERSRMLHRAGLQVFPLPFSAWRREPAACLAAVRERLGGAGAPRSPVAGAVARGG